MNAAPASSRPARLLVGAVAALVPLLAGCTIPTGDPTTQPGDQPTDSVTASATPGEVESSSAAQAGIDLTNLPAPIASATVAATVEGDPAAKLTVNLHQLRRSGKVVIATFSFQLSSTVDEQQSLFGLLGQHVWWPYLVDTRNLKRHDVVIGGGSRAKTDEVSVFGPGQTLYAYAMFAAPPATVTTMDVQMLDVAPTVTNAPIT